jgi:hypothetical protein
MQLDSQYLHCIQKAPTQGVGRTKPHPDRFDRLVEGISRMLKQYEDHCFGNKDTQMILCIAEYKIKIEELDDSYSGQLLKEKMESILNGLKNPILNHISKIIGQYRNEHKKWHTIRMGVFNSYI